MLRSLLARVTPRIAGCGIGGKSRPLDRSGHLSREAGDGEIAGGKTDCHSCSDFTSVELGISCVMTGRRKFSEKKR